MCVRVLATCMSVNHMCLVSTEARRRHWVPETVVTDGDNHHVRAGY